MTDTFLTPSQIAELCKVSRSHVYRLIQAREIPVVYIGECPRVTRQDFDKWVSQGGSRPNPTTRRRSTCS